MIPGIQEETDDRARSPITWNLFYLFPGRLDDADIAGQNAKRHGRSLFRRTGNARADALPRSMFEMPWGISSGPGGTATGRRRFQREMVQPESPGSRQQDSTHN